MSKLGSFYRIDDPDLIKQIDAFFAVTRQFDEQVKVLCDTYGVEHYVSYNSVLGGIGFCHLIAEKDQVIDEKKWRVLKHKNPRYKILKPRRSNKAFCAEYDALVPKKVDYRPLINLVIHPTDRRHLLGFGYKHRDGQPFYLDTAFKPCDGAIEVVASEYRNAYEDEEQEQST